LDSLIERISWVANVVIILSSSWRINITASKLKHEVFSDWNFSRYLIDKTPFIGVYSRWEEISSWLEQNRERNIKNFVILDDYPVDGFPREHYVYVDDLKLLSQENVDEAFEKLGLSEAKLELLG
jgi:hypothetical protein